jgi:hypothetical protein
MLTTITTSTAIPFTAAVTAAAAVVLACLPSAVTVGEVPLLEVVILLTSSTRSILRT